MNKIVKNIIGLVFVFLIIGNVYIFVSGIKISDEINRFDKTTAVYHQENIDLEKKINEISSLQHTASIAGELDFTEKPQTFVIESQKYALKK